MKELTTVHRINKQWIDIVEFVTKKGCFSFGDITRNFEIYDDDRAILRHRLIQNGIIHDRPDGWLCEAIK